MVMTTDYRHRDDKRDYINTKINMVFFIIVSRLIDVTATSKDNINNQYPCLFIDNSDKWTDHSTGVCQQNPIVLEIYRCVALAHYMKTMNRQRLLPSNLTQTDRR